MTSYAIYPVGNWEVITPSDSDALEFSGKEARCRAIYIGVAGDLAIRNEDGTTVILTNLLAGVVYPISTDQILASGTDADEIVAGFDKP